MVSHPHYPLGGDATEPGGSRDGAAVPCGRLIAYIRLGADNLLNTLFVADGVPPYSFAWHVDRMERVIVKEEPAMRLRLQDLCAPGGYQATSPSISSRPNTSVLPSLSIREVRDSSSRFLYTEENSVAQINVKNLPKTTLTLLC